MSAHSLPLHIFYNGKADIVTAFSVILSDDENFCSASFRGRKLFGHIHKLPDNHEIKHVCYNKINKLITENIHAPSGDSNIIEWNKDDVREPAHINLRSFESYSSFQSKVNNFFAINHE